LCEFDHLADLRAVLSQSELVQVNGWAQVGRRRELVEASVRTVQAGERLSILTAQERPNEVRSVRSTHSM
jgi:hypothetical protein